MELIIIFCLSMQLILISRMYEMMKDWMIDNGKE